MLIIRHFLIVLLLATGLNAVGQQKPAVKVSGEVTHPLTLYPENLRQMKRTTVALKDHEGNERAYTGVPVQEILEQAGVTTGKTLKGKNLRKYLLVRCADGYEVLFSLAELDSAFTDKVVILADESGGQPLPAGKGPFRLVVPGEKKPARSSFQVTDMIVGFARD
ncbi:molybdopterin-dependent oxidoreductase [Chitinophaga qingshengii]|uniref:Molybdopterin-dependent oxidoreductase n=1 Tax=Chitinophaga qingshengii TaxID=1569794 RepID=A0ABR7TYJ1_9BACT|nr:molybdopterin-dependent oxidoreductase [Chitinophaga qingshengii]MBC9934239.1 molybdopterin-dependent oxidoreductase [Chitinophaga qingshengii]